MSQPECKSSLLVEIVPSAEWKLIYWLFCHTTPIPLSPYRNIRQPFRTPFADGHIPSSASFSVFLFFLLLFNKTQFVNERHWQLIDLPLENAKLSQTSVVCFCVTAIWTPQTKTQAVIDTDPRWDGRWSCLLFFLLLSLSTSSSQPLPQHAAGPTPLPQYSRDYWQPTKLDWKRGEQVQTRW